MKIREISEMKVHEMGPPTSVCGAGSQEGLDKPPC
jgi:hypothetical protein